MLVPDMVVVPQLLVVTLPSLAADTTFSPGIVRSGLMRLSSVGPQLLNPAMDSADAAWLVGPTEIAFFAVDGVPTVAVPGPELPAAKKIWKSLWFHMNSSTSWVAAV